MNTTTGRRSYIATLPPLPVTGNVSQRLEASWDPSYLVLKDAPVIPQYWNITYYEGSTVLNPPPTTLSDWARVSRMVATTDSDLTSEGLDGERQAIVSRIPTDPVKPAWHIPPSGHRG